MFQSSINLVSSTAEFGTQIGVLSARKFENGHAECKDRASENDNSRNDEVEMSMLGIKRKIKNKLKSDINKNNFM